MFREFIKATGETQLIWAKRLGVSSPYLSDLIAGKKTPSLALAVRIEQETSGAVSVSSWVSPHSEDAA